MRGKIRTMQMILKIPQSGIRREGARRVVAFMVNVAA